MSRFPTRVCPICQSTRSQLLFHQSFAQLSNAHLLDGYDVVICNACGFGYADQIPEQHVFDEYYRDLSKYDYMDHAGLPPTGADQRFVDIGDILERFIPERTSRVFEIGGGSSQLLDVLQRRGYSRLLGSDPSPGCVRAAKQLYNVDAIACTIFNAPQPAEPYDFLIVIGVMEHIRDLDRAVAEFHRLLAPGGRIYVESPDGSRYQPSLDAPFQEFSVEHINYFSLTSLTNLMHSRGFQCVGSGRVMRPQHEVSVPAMYGIYERTGKPLPITRDEETGPGLSAYIEGCRTEDVRIRARIERALGAGEQMIVWGVGAHTLRLLAVGGIDPAKVALFVDSSPKYQNQELRGVPVVGPAALDGRGEPILISSRGFQNEIRDDIVHRYNLKNRLILLYE